MTALTRRGLLGGAAVAAAATASFGVPPAQAAAPLTGKQGPSFYRYKVGDFEVTAMSEGSVRNAAVKNMAVNKDLPDIEKALGAAFLPMAISAGLTSAIMDARSPQIVRAVKAADLLLDRDAWGAAWIAAHRAQQAQQAAT